MNRRDFLRRASLVAAGAVAADQLDLIERLGWRRKFFPGWSAPQRQGDLYRITGIQSSFYPDRMSTVEISLQGEHGMRGAVVLDADAARPLMAQFHAGDLVRVEGEWGDWVRMSKSLLDPKPIIGARYSPDVWAR